ncbi:MAG: ABC transporter ATP-binding protein [Actinobacteria bacterium]|nr:ABC transporter ATP-binding protein [Actinomycetota bacterium]
MAQHFPRPDDPNQCPFGELHGGWFERRPGSNKPQGTRLTKPLLSVRDLRTHFDTDEGVVKAVDGVSFEIMPTEVFAIVGESGSGKTVTALSVLNLVPKPAGKIVSGEIIFQDTNILQLPKDELQNLRGDRIVMIFQDPLTALNPVFSVGHQIAEVYRAHRGLGKKEAHRNAVELLELVGIPRPDQRAREYPHQFSGGMRQRAMIAMAVALNPDLIIADEPTTALDVTIQAQIMEVLLRMREEFDAAIMLITHDLGVVAGVADRVMVMYAGKVAEMGTCEEVYFHPRHPYTWGLMTSITRADQRKKDRLIPIRGTPPSLVNLPSGCPFHPRCDFAEKICSEDYPDLRPVSSHGQIASCHFAQRPDWTPPAELVAGRARR